MTTALVMEDDGTSHEVKLSRNSMTSDSVYCFIDNTTKSIYIWLGKKAGVRKRFVGAQTASKMRSANGFGFKVKSLDEGSEPSNFLNFIVSE